MIIKFVNRPQVLSALSTFERELVRGIRREVTSFLREEFRKSQEDVPVRTRRLRRSGRVDEAKLQPTGRGISGGIEYRAHYAHIAQKRTDYFPQEDDREVQRKLREALERGMEGAVKAMHLVGRVD